MVWGRLQVSATKLGVGAAPGANRQKSGPGGVYAADDLGILAATTWEHQHNMPKVEAIQLLELGPRMFLGKLAQSLKCPQEHGLVDSATAVLKSCCGTVMALEPVNPSLQLPVFSCYFQQISPNFPFKYIV